MARYHLGGKDCCRDRPRGRGLRPISRPARRRTGFFAGRLGPPFRRGADVVILLACSGMESLFRDSRGPFGSRVLWLGVAALLLALFVAWLWLPSVAARRAEKMLSARTGMVVTIGDVHLGFSSVSVEDMVAEGTSPKVKATIKAATIHSSPVRLAVGGAAAVQRVDTSGVRIEADLSAAGAPSPQSGRGPGTRGTGAAVRGPSGRGRQITASQVTWTVRDADGGLTRGQLDTARWVAGRLSVEGVSATLGSERAPAFAVERASAAMVRAPTGWALASCELLGARVGLHPAASEDSLRSLRRRFRRALGGANDARPGAPEPSGTQAVADTLPSTPPNTLADDPGAEGAADTAASPAAAASPPVFDVDVFSRLEPGVQCRIEGLSAYDHASGRAALLMDDVDAQLHENARGELKIVASGKGAAGGKLSTDLAVSRAPLQVDGRVTLEGLPLSLLAPALPALPWAEPEGTTVDAELRIATRSVKEIAAEGAVTVANLQLMSERIATEPVRFAPLEFAGKARLLPLDRKLVLDEAALTVGGARALLQGSLAYRAPDYVVNLDATVPRTGCGDVIRAIPDALLGGLVDARLSGGFRGRLHLALDSLDLDATELEIGVDDRCEFRRMPAMADLRRFRQPFMHTVTEPDGEVFRMQTGPGTRSWTYLEDISPFLVHAVLAHEDAQFFNHHGFSPLHIRNALVRNLREGRYVVGASTITMQLVKNVFLHREKTLARKVQEVILTWWLEQVLEKREIMELYLNVIEYGPAVYGLRHAANYYFKRLPSDLSPAEAVFLSTILPAPKRYHGMYDKGRLSSGWQERMRAIFRRMQARQWYTPEAVQYGMTEIDRFRFYKPGEVSPPRVVPGSTALLPYQEPWGSGYHNALGAGPAGHLDLSDF